MYLPTVFNSARRPMPDALVQATIRTDCLRRNVQSLQDRAHPASLMAVLKADAYGHGVRTIAPLLQDAGVRAFAVARVHEAVVLRQLGIRGVILVLAPPTATELSVYQQHRLHASVTSPAVVDMVCRADLDTPLSVHVNVDTGMHRLGLDWRRVPTQWRRLHDASSVETVGMYTHLATADTPDHPLNDRQLRHFTKAVQDAYPTPTVVHVANTDALTQLPNRLPEGTQYVRTGLGLYGLTSVPPRSMQNGDGGSDSPRGERLGVKDQATAPNYTSRCVPLRPVLSLRAQVIHTHTVPEGETVSYGACWTAPRDTSVATLGIGYGDGYPRSASGNGRVRLHGEQRPLVGRVCMDLCMVDLGSPNSPLAQRTTVGDTAVLFDQKGPTVYDVARWSATIPYEICCQLAPRVSRRYRPRVSTAALEDGTI